MTLYRKRPIELEAAQWFINGDHPDDDCFRPFEDTGEVPTVLREGKLVRFYRHPSIDGDQQCKHCGKIMHFHGWIETLEGGHIVCPSDWIMTGTEGEHWPVKNNVFLKTYEKVEKT